MLESNVAWLHASGNVTKLRDGFRGIEKESLRVDARGRLAMTAHPRALGSALTHPYLTTDYSEALLEFVTPPAATNWQTLQFLCDLHSHVHRHLDAEMLWPASMPCVLDPDEIPIADYGTSNAGLLRTVYRRGLGHRYGRAMQAIAGVHFNFSPPAAFWEPYRDFRESRLPLAAFKAEQLMGLVRNYRRCAWLVVYLFGASPAFCKSFQRQPHALLDELDPGTWYAPYATSLRMSDIGYRNSTQARLNISANSLAEYIAGLKAAVTTPDERYTSIGIEVDGEYRQLNANILQIENEYYSSVRPKPRDRSVRPIVGLKRDGVEYVEIRTLDLSIADPVGVNQAQLRLLEALLIQCLLATSPPISPDEQAEIDARDVQVAREGRRPGLSIRVADRSMPLRTAALELLDRVALTAELLDASGGDYAAALTAARAAVATPETTPSARLLAGLEEARASFFEYVLEIARSHRAYFLALDLDADKEAQLSAAAERSLRDLEALERRPQPGFGEYLRRRDEGL